MDEIDPETENPFEVIPDPEPDEGENIPLDNFDEHTPLIEREDDIDNAWNKIHGKYPNVNPKTAPFTVTMDKYGNVLVKLKRLGGKARALFNMTGGLNEKLPASIKKSLGPSTDEIMEEMVRTNEEKIAEKEEELGRADDEDQIAEIRNEIEKIERENEEIEEKISLKERVKTIFKKYGFTATAVLAAVGVIIGVIVSNMKAGLTSVAKGVGNGLKAIGKKLGELLPGMVGAIASFIFKTAGEVVGFLAKNAWMLVVGVVLYIVERFKKKK